MPGGSAAHVQQPAIAITVDVTAGAKQAPGAAFIAAQAAKSSVESFTQVIQASLVSQPIGDDVEHDRDIRIDNADRVPRPSVPGPFLSQQKRAILRHTAPQSVVLALRGLPRVFHAGFQGAGVSGPVQSAAGHGQ
jgi:hypothetical protein